MDKWMLENIKTLLENYNKELTNKSEKYADFMCDWADASQSETVRYANLYALNRKERQRVQMALYDITTALEEA